MHFWDDRTLYVMEMQALICHLCVVGGGHVPPQIHVQAVSVDTLDRNVYNSVVTAK
jgi:hypothetical protein